MNPILPSVRLLALAATAITLAFSAKAGEPSIAAYRWPNGTDNLDAFAKWLGRETVWGEDFIGSESWDTFSGQPGGSNTGASGSLKNPAAG